MRLLPPSGCAHGSRGPPPATGRRSLLDRPRPLRTRQARRLAQLRRRRAVLPRRQRREPPGRRTGGHAKGALCLAQPWRQACPVRLPGAHPLAAPATATRRPAAAAVRRIRQLVPRHQPAQRGAGVPRGLPEQPVVDVRPHPAAHRPGRRHQQQHCPAQLRAELRRLHRRHGQQHPLCLERPDGRLSRPVRAGPVPGEAGRVQPPGEPRPLGIQAEPHARGDRAHGRTRLGTQAGPLRLLLLRRELFVPPARTDGDRPPGHRADRAVPAYRDPHRHRPRGEERRADRAHRLPAVAREGTARPRRTARPCRARLGQAPGGRRQPARRSRLQGPADAAPGADPGRRLPPGALPRHRSGA